MAGQAGEGKEAVDRGSSRGRKTTEISLVNDHPSHEEQLTHLTNQQRQVPARQTQSSLHANWFALLAARTLCFHKRTWHSGMP